VFEQWPYSQPWNIMFKYKLIYAKGSKFHGLVVCLYTSYPKHMYVCMHLPITLCFQNRTKQECHNQYWKYQMILIHFLLLNTQEGTFCGLIIHQTAVASEKKKQYNLKWETTNQVSFTASYPLLKHEWHARK
jgi:hypothetical protein